MAQNPFLTSANPQQLSQFQELPPELQSEYKDINRQQRIGDVLTSQAFNQPQGQMVSGRYVAPSFFQNLAPVANAFLGNYASNKAEQRQSMLAQKLREGGQKELQTFNEIAQGTPDRKGDLAAALRFAQTAQFSPQLRNISNELMKPRTMKKGETFVVPSMTGGDPTVLASGAPDIPDSIQTAAITLGIKGDPRTWTPAQVQAVSNQVLNLKRASGTNINISQSTGKSLAGEVGPILKESAAQTQGAYSTIDAADKILTALETNNLITGPLAQQRIQATRWATSLGLAGKDEGQKLANTTQAVQGLAGLVLAGRRQMRGEGAITGSESQLAERAMSGDINFTPAELVALSNAAKRAGQYQIQTHNQKLDAMRADPDLKPLVPFYSVLPMGAPPAAAATGTSAATPAMSAADAIIGRP
jgi:hypothetical protein